MAGVDANGHFNIPEGTTTIVGRHPYLDGGGADSWAEWGVDKTTVRSVTIPLPFAGTLLFFSFLFAEPI